MRFRPIVATSSLALFSLSAAQASVRVHRGPTASHAHKTASAVRKAPAPRAIEPERASQIQAALIKAGYLTTPASGVWDSETEAAMEKLQADNGWQTKLVPDSRAILKLGLGGGASAGTAETASESRPLEAQPAQTYSSNQ